MLMNKFKRIAGIVCKGSGVLIILSILFSEANARVCFLPGNQCDAGEEGIMVGVDTIDEETEKPVQVGQCTSYTLKEVNCKGKLCEEGWNCSSCVPGLGMDPLYRCEEAETPNGYKAGLNSCTTSCQEYTIPEVGHRFTGSKLNGKCTAISGYSTQTPAHCTTYVMPEYTYGINISNDEIKVQKRADCYYNVAPLTGGDYKVDVPGTKDKYCYEYDSKEGSDGVRCYANAVNVDESYTTDTRDSNAFIVDEKKGKDRGQNTEPKTCYKATDCNTSNGWLESDKVDGTRFDYAEKSSDGIICRKANACQESNNWYNEENLGQFSNFFKLADETRSGLTCYQATGCNQYAYETQPDSRWFTSAKMTSNGHDCWVVTGIAEHAYTTSQRKNNFFEYETKTAYLNGTAEQVTFHIVKHDNGKNGCMANAYESTPDAKYFASSSETQYSNGSATQKTCWNITGKGGHAYAENEKKTTHFVYDEGREGYLNGSSTVVKYFNVTSCSDKAYTSAPAATCYSSNSETQDKGGIANNALTCWNITGKGEFAYKANERILNYFAYDACTEAYLNGTDTKEVFYKAKSCMANAYAAAPDVKYFAIASQVQHKNGLGGTDNNLTCWNITGRGAYAYTEAEKATTHFAYDASKKGYLNGTPTEVEYFNVTGCGSKAYASAPDATCYSSGSLTQNKGGIANNTLTCWNVTGKGVYAYKANERILNYFAYDACNAAYLNGTSTTEVFYKAKGCMEYAYAAAPDVKYFSIASQVQHKGGLGGTDNDLTCWNITGKGAHAYTSNEKILTHFAYDTGKKGYLNGTTTEVEYFNVTGCGANAYESATDTDYFAYNSETQDKGGVANNTLTCYNATGCTGEAKLHANKDLVHFKYNNGKSRHFNGADAETSCYLADGCGSPSTLLANLNNTMYVYDAGRTENGITCHKVMTCNKGYKQATANNGFGLSCTQCDKGSWNATPGATSCTLCTEGKYLDVVGATSNQCKACTKGHKCPTEGMAEPTLCEVGSYQDEIGKTACKTCGTGARDTANRESCSICAAGTYANDTHTACVACPEGYSCNDGVTTICPAGSYQAEAGKATCTPCEAGHFCTGGTHNAKCVAGTYTATTGKASCDTCTAGNYNTGTGNTGCTQCEAGHFCTGGAHNAVCAAGTYNTTKGNSACTNCEAGKFCTGGTHNEACAVGTYTATTGKSSCDTCTAGNYNTGTGNTGCTACEAGHFCTGGAHNAACVAGTYTATTGKSSCDTCTAGNYNTGTGNTGCTQCEAGHFCTGGAHNAVCAAGTYNTTKGNSACTPCEAGKFCTGGTHNEACAVGTFTSIDNQSHCTTCAPGTYNTGTGNTGCTPCEEGHFCKGGAHNDACAAGTYTATTGKSSCDTCAAGTYNTTTGNTGCLACGQGYYCTGGTNHTVCGKGKFNAGTNGKSSSDCTPCGKGTYNDKDAAASCTNCPKGTASDATGATSDSVCSTCAAGKYAPKGSAACLNCANGTWSAAGSERCDMCYIGYEDWTGTTDPDWACSKCPAGSYKDANGNEPCTQCTAGTYNPNTGSTSSAACSTCTCGHYCATGAANPVQCAAGRYAAAGSSECSTCTAGHKCPSKGMCTQTNCDAGTYQNEAGKTDCKACTQGHKCPNAAMSTPTNCDAGTYQDATGQTACKACTAGHKCPSAAMSTPTDCDAGTYQDATGQTACKACTAGHKCPTAAMEAMDNCPAGTYQNEGSQTTCKTCTAGFKCPNATMSAPTACPAGTYQDATGQTDCKACTGNTYSTGASTGTTACTSCESNYVNDARNGCDEYTLSASNATIAANVTSTTIDVTSEKGSTAGYAFTVSGGSSSTCTASVNSAKTAITVTCTKNISFTDNRTVTFTLHQYRGPTKADFTITVTLTQTKDACGTSGAQNGTCSSTQKQDTKASDSVAGQTCYVCTDCTTAYPAISNGIGWATSTPSGCYVLQSDTAAANCTSYKKYVLQNASCVTSMESCYTYDKIKGADNVQYYYNKNSIGTGYTTSTISSTYFTTETGKGTDNVNCSRATGCKSGYTSGYSGAANCGNGGSTGWTFDGSYTSYFKDGGTLYCGKCTIKNGCATNYATSEVITTQCGAGGSTGWSLSTTDKYGYYGNTQCGKCTIKNGCTANYATSSNMSNCGAGGATGWSLSTTDKSGYYGNTQCGKCVIKNGCTANYATSDIMSNCGDGGATGWNLSTTDKSGYYGNTQCGKCVEKNGCTSGYAKAAASCGNGNGGATGWSLGSTHSGWYGNTKCYNCVAKNGCASGYAKDVAGCGTGSWTLSTTDSNGWYGDTKCYKCLPADTCATGYKTAAASCGNGNGKDTGWRLDTSSASGYVGASPCYKCVEKNGCSDSTYKTSADSCGNGTGKSNGWYLNTNSAGGWYGDTRCYKCTASACATNYKTAAASCGTSGANGWNLNTSDQNKYSGDSPCYKCTAKACATNYKTAAAYCGNGNGGATGWELKTNSSNGYSGDSVCYLCAEKNGCTDSTYKTAASSCGTTGANGWSLNTNSAGGWYGDTRCYKCTANACATNYKTSAASCGSTGTNGWYLNTNDQNKYSGDTACYKCTASACASGYKTAAASCGTSGTSGWQLNTNDQNKYSGDTACYKCTAKSCASGYQTAAANCGTGGATGWKLNSNTNAHSGDSVCYQCEAINGCTNSNYKTSAANCGTTGASGWTLNTNDAGGYIGNDRCYKCTAKSCDSGYSTSYTKVADCGAGGATGWTYTQGTTYNGNSVCGKCTERNGCASNFSQNTTSCSANQYITATNGGYYGNTTCKKCVNCDAGYYSNGGTATGCSACTYSGYTLTSCPTGCNCYEGTCPTNSTKKYYVYGAKTGYYQSDQACYTCVSAYPAHSSTTLGAVGWYTTTTPSGCFVRFKENGSPKPGVSCGGSTYYKFVRFADDDCTSDPNSCYNWDGPITAADGKSYYYDAYDKYVFSASSTSVPFNAAKKSSTDLTVTSTKNCGNQSFSVAYRSGTSNFCTVTAGTGKITYTCTANTSTSSRSATYRLTQSGSGNTVDITFTQSGDSCANGATLTSTWAAGKYGFTVGTSVAGQSCYAIYDCPTGMYCPNPNGTTITCPVDTYQDQTGQTSCKSCATGYTTGAVTGATSSSACNACKWSGYMWTSCPDGTTCTDHTCGGETRFGFSSCKDTYSTCGTTCYKAAESCSPTSTTNCVTSGCVKRATCNSSTGTVTYTQGNESTGGCNAGQYCNSGSCTTCPAGTYNSSSGTSNGKSSCTTCPAGKKCPAGSTSPTPCPADTFQASTGQSTCRDCDSGFTTNGATGQTSCVKCDFGSYPHTSCPTGANCSSKTCGGTTRYKVDSCQTYYALCGNTCYLTMPSNYGSTTSVCVTYQTYDLQECSNGSITTSHVSNPVSGGCSAGQYCNNGTCTSCAAGKYQNASGTSNGQTSCKTCADGYYSSAGASSCTICSNGYWSKNDKSGCRKCSYTANTTQYPVTSCPSGATCSYHCVVSGTVRYRVTGCTNSNYKVNSSYSDCVQKDCSDINSSYVGSNSYEYKNYCNRCVSAGIYLQCTGIPVSGADGNCYAKQQQQSSGC